MLLTFAYDVRNYTDRFDVSFTPSTPEITPEPGMGREKMEALFNRQRQRMNSDKVDKGPHMQTGVAR